jgi:hypothetical protein
MRFMKKLVPQIQTIYGFSSVWYDISSEGIQGGDNWWNTIEQSIRDCELVLFLMSDTSVNSIYCYKELVAAMYNKKTILPVLIPTYTLNYPDSFGGTVANHLHDIHYIDFRKGLRNLSPLWGAINRVTDQSISKANRWILYNQYEILSLLYQITSRSGNSDYYREHQEIIGRGYEWYYSEISQGVEQPMAYGESEEVITILDMFRAIDNACIRGIDCSDIRSYHLKFSGFDGNNETNYYSFARFTIFEKGLFEESKPDTNDINSHFPMLPKYRKMLVEWKKSNQLHSLTKEDILRIVNA